ncbi:hypothetical protein BDN67DRAFT_976371 [Paxillus ammoniavirescens]|nr:hypothetical protein BDN67DRAFT_976371 [Paxillus ammoniavirescens]
MYRQTHLGHPRHPPTPCHDLPTSRTCHDTVEDSRQDLRESAEPERTEYAPCHTVVSTTTPAQPDATETVRSYLGSIPEPPDPRTKSTEAHTSTPHTVDTTYTANYHIG